MWYTKLHELENRGETWKIRYTTVSCCKYLILGSIIENDRKMLTIESKHGGEWNGGIFQCAMP
jgi:hypothetical protein